LGYFLTVRVPVIVALKLSLSWEPASVAWIENTPVKDRVPETPLYFPVPERTLAVPRTVTGVGAAEFTAHAWVALDVTMDNFSELRAPVSDPAPENGLQVLEAVPLPEPASVLAAPRRVAEPLPCTPVAWTPVELQSNAMVPEYLAVNFTLVTFALTTWAVALVA
jgi:hypothetical protein